MEELPHGQVIKTPHLFLHTSGGKKKKVDKNYQGNEQHDQFEEHDDVMDEDDILVEKNVNDEDELAEEEDLHDEESSEDHDVLQTQHENLPTRNSMGH